MAFTGQENHSISLTEASNLTRNYRIVNPNSIKAGFFGRDTIERILAKDGCVGIRIYYALDDSSVPTLVLVGADANENDLVDGEIAERPTPCPPDCGQANVINS